MYHIDQDEIVARTTKLLPLDEDVEAKKQQFLTHLMEEVQLLKLISEPKHVVGVKEEIIVLSEQLDLLNYCAIVEKAESTLDSYVESAKYKNSRAEIYSAERLGFYFH